MRNSITIGYVQQLIDNLAKEVSITTGGYFNIYFSKKRKSWVIHYAQTKKVENGDLEIALEDAITKLKQSRNHVEGKKFTMYTPKK